MSDWAPFLDTLASEESSAVQCKLCRFIGNADPDVQKLVLRAVREKDDEGNFVYSAGTIVRAFKAQGALSLSESSVKRHRSFHER